MTHIVSRYFLSRPASLRIALLAGACLWGCAGTMGSAWAAPDGAKPARISGGIHAKRLGDMPGARDDAKMMINALQAQCGSAVMRQACLTIQTDPAATPKARARCLEMMSPFRLSGSLDSVGERTIDEYFAPALNRAVRIVKATMAKQTGVCSAEVVQEETRVITQYRPDGYTRYEYRKNRRGEAQWVQSEHTFSPGLAGMFKSALDTAKLGGTLSVSAPLGNKMLTPGRSCEVRRIGAGRVEFVSCIHATGRDFPTHITFESEVIGDGKTRAIEKFVSFDDNVALSSDLFTPGPVEGRPSGKKPGRDPNNPMSRWCAVEKARTGVDPCKDDDE